MGRPAPDLGRSPLRTLRSKRHDRAMGLCHPRRLFAPCVVAVLTLTSSCNLSGAFLQPREQWLVEPDAFGLAFEEFELATGRSTSVHGWFLENPVSDGRTVVLCHGSAANISFYHPYYTFLHAAGYHVALFDYRGYGQSDGDVSISALFDDTERVLEFVRARPEVDPTRVVLFGTSLGSVVALRTAARTGDLAGLVVEDALSPRRYLKRELGGFGAWLVSAFALPSEMEPDANARELDCPSLFVAGAWDPDLLTHLEVAAAAAEPSVCWIQPDTAHAPNGLLQHDGEYQAAIAHFMDACVEGTVRRVEVSVEDGAIELTRTDGGVEPLAMELCLVDSDGGARFERLWLSGAPRIVAPSEPFVHATIWEYRRTEGSPDSGTWGRTRSQLARSAETLGYLTSIAQLVRDSATPIVEARVFAAELAAGEERDGALHPLAAAELVPHLVEIGEVLIAAPESADRAAGRGLLERALGAEPANHDAHYWPSASYRVGFPHGPALERARARLAEPAE